MGAVKLLMRQGLTILIDLDTKHGFSAKKKALSDGAVCGSCDARIDSRSNGPPKNDVRFGGGSA
ncbi:MAG: hypothetical protein M3O66_02765, partial [Verrucomicrobiota bacterium]|nr:hypothetical protein [Verrucomicrobiota bacterium]